LSAAAVRDMIAEMLDYVILKDPSDHVPEKFYTYPCQCLVQSVTIFLRLLRHNLGYRLNSF
jgi:hypothetical protein